MGWVRPGGAGGQHVEQEEVRVFAAAATGDPDMPVGTKLPLLLPDPRH